MVGCYDNIKDERLERKHFKSFHKSAQYPRCNRGEGRYGPTGSQPGSLPDFNHFWDWRKVSLRGQPGHPLTCSLLMAVRTRSSHLVAPWSLLRRPLDKRRGIQGARLQPLLLELPGGLASLLLSNRPAQAPFPVICSSWGAPGELAARSCRRRFPAHSVAPLGQGSEPLRAHWTAEGRGCFFCLEEWVPFDYDGHISILF